MTYWNESDKQSEKVREFMSNHNIPSPALWRGNILYIKKCSDMSDNNFLKKTVKGNGSVYYGIKKTSPLGKELKTLGVRRIFKPFVLLFFEEMISKASVCLFPANGKVYCSLEHTLEKPLTCPEGFIEMKGSAFYKIMEGEEDA
jgi:hypothetical protein